jgi:hypothetical protein
MPRYVECFRDPYSKDPKSRLANLSESLSFQIAKARSRRPRKRLAVDGASYATSSGAAFPTHPSFGSIAHPLYANWQASASESALDVTRSAPENRAAFSLSQISRNMPFGLAAAQPTLTSAAERMLRRSQGATQADAIFIDD